MSMNVSLRQLKCFLRPWRIAAVLPVRGRAGARPVRRVAADPRAGGRVGDQANFDHTTRRVELTDHRREFRVHAQKLMADLDYAVRNVQDLVARKRRRLVVAALLAAQPRRCCPRRSRASGATIRAMQVALVDVPTDQIWRGCGRARPTSASAPSSARRRGSTSTMVEDELRLFCPAKHTLLKTATVDWRSLRGASLIGLNRASGIQALIDGVFERLALSPAYVHEVACRSPRPGAGRGGPRRRFVRRAWRGWASSRGASPAGPWPTRRCGAPSR